MGVRTLTWVTGVGASPRGGFRDAAFPSLGSVAWCSNRWPVGGGDLCHLWQTADVSRFLGACLLDFYLE